MSLALVATTKKLDVRRRLKQRGVLPGLGCRYSLVRFSRSSTNSITPSVFCDRESCEAADAEQEPERTHLLHVRILRRQLRSLSGSHLLAHVLWRERREPWTTREPPTWFALLNCFLSPASAMAAEEWARGRGWRREDGSLERRIATTAGSEGRDRTRVASRDSDGGAQASLTPDARMRVNT